MVVGAENQTTLPHTIHWRGLPPRDRANAIVTRSLRGALSGAIAILMLSKDADPKMGHGDEILVR